MDSLAAILLPACVALMMLIVGLELQRSDFRRLGALPGGITLLSMAQMAVPIVAGCLTIAVLRPPPHVVGGLVILAACPTGGLSNVFTFHAGGRTALAVVLCCTSSLLAALALPGLIALGFAILLEVPVVPEESTFVIVGQSLLAIAVPIALGMGLRERAPSVVERARPVLRPLSLVLLASVVTFMLAGHPKSQPGDIVPSVAPGAVFTIVAMALGWALGGLMRLTNAERVALMFSTGIRNVAVAGVIAISVLDRIDFAQLIGGYLVAQVPIALALIVVRRRVMRSTGQVPASLA